MIPFVPIVIAIVVISAVTAGHHGHFGLWLLIPMFFLFRFLLWRHRPWGMRPAGTRPLSTGRERVCKPTTLRVIGPATDRDGAFDPNRSRPGGGAISHPAGG